MSNAHSCKEGNGTQLPSSLGASDGTRSAGSMKAIFAFFFPFPFAQAEQSKSAKNPLRNYHPRGRSGYFYGNKGSGNDSLDADDDDDDEGAESAETLLRPSYGLLSSSSASSGAGRRARAGGGEAHKS